MVIETERLLLKEFTHEDFPDNLIKTYFEAMQGDGKIKRIKDRMCYANVFYLLE